MSRSVVRFAFIWSALAAAAALVPSGAAAQPVNRGYLPGGGWAQGQPIVRLRADGGGTVNLRNGCIVSYNYYGTRISSTRVCTSAMRRYADQVFRDQRWQRPGTGWGGGWGAPRLDVVGMTIRAQMTGTDCTYVYNRGGNHIQSIGRQCNPTLRDRANDAVRRLRQQQGW